nr:macro domain-containing protein [Gemmatimonadota bacterium]NIR78731.1 macro domain-containing protein [Gemmatimonadota bacterium]NIT87370.1 macro domain-containing protein [Gemmatimonadota bacterium]NIU31214.1 macro domain-containing protein [Gemmatimonadota bacterium]NIU35935.1 macro domain-containing protein [Gemmatimonadota bacterium]
VAAAIASAAGPSLSEESRAWVREHGPVPTGEAAVTTAGDLPHRGVIHAVGPRQGEGDEEEKLTGAVAASLDRAAENGWSSVALPAISAGIFGVPYAVCARAYVAGVERHLEESPESPVNDVRLCLFRPDDELLSAVENALEAGF